MLISSQGGFGSWNGELLLFYEVSVQIGDLYGDRMQVVFSGVCSGRGYIKIMAGDDEALRVEARDPALKDMSDDAQDSHARLGGVGEFLLMGRGQPFPKPTADVGGLRLRLFCAGDPFLSGRAWSLQLGGVA